MPDVPMIDSEGILSGASKVIVANYDYNALIDEPKASDVAAILGPSRL